MSKWWALGLLVLSLETRAAFRLSSLVLRLSPEEAKSTSFFVENTGDEKIAVQLEIFKRRTGEKGREVREATDEIDLVPSQFVLPAHQRRSVHLRWRATELRAEKSYRLVASELPVSFQASVKKVFLSQYVASIFIARPEWQADVQVLGFRVDKDRHARMSLVNKGQVHQLLAGSEITIDGVDGKNPRRLSFAKEMDGLNILAEDHHDVDVGLVELAPGDYGARIQTGMP